MTPRPEPGGLRPPTHCQEDQGWASVGTVTFYWAQPRRHPEGGFCSHRPALTCSEPAP